MILELAAAAGICAASQTPVLPAPRVIVRSGTPALGYPGPFDFEYIHRPSINARGDVMFGADIENNTSAVWLSTAQGLQTVVYGFQPAPGLPGVSFNNPCIGCSNEFPMLSDTGLIVMDMSLLGPGVNNQNNSAIYSGTPDQLELIIREGDTPPGYDPPVSFWGPGVVAAINDAGVTAFSASTSAPGIDYASVWMGTPGALEVAVKGGTQAPGLDAGFLFAGFSVASLNNDGTLAFKAGAYNGNTPHSGVWAGQAGNLSLVAEADTLAPGTPYTFNGNYNDGFNDVRLNNTGQVAFTGYLDGPDGNENGIWAGTPGDIHLVAYEGGTAIGPNGPDTVLGVSRAALADNGNIAFLGYFDNPNTAPSDVVVYRTTPGADLEMIAATGAEVPGLNGALLKGFDQPLINALGQVGFLATLMGDGVTAQNDEALFLTGPDGTPFLLAREGDAFEVEPGVFETIVGFGDLVGSTSQDIGRTGISDNGELVTTLLYPGGVAAVAFTIPAPGAGLVLLLGAGAAARRTRPASRTA